MGRDSDSKASLSDLVLDFLEDKDEERRPEDEGDDDSGSVVENKAFWESQSQLLQEALDRNSSSETRIRVEAEKLLGKLEREEAVCSCSSWSNGECCSLCRKCLMRALSDCLREEGYNSALCRSKWRRSTDIPAGEHSYIDVMVDSKNGKRVGGIRVVIELSFRAEFEMARASEEYGGLVKCLPEVFVGKSERLRNVVKIMCAAAKKCTKENKMHMAPWRKHKYMQAKWLGDPERMVRQGSPLPQSATSDRQPKARASMLTLDLHRTIVEVL